MAAYKKIKDSPKMLDHEEEESLKNHGEEYEDKANENRLKQTKRPMHR